MGNGFLQVNAVVVVVLVTVLLLECCSPSEAQLNPVDEAALFDLCDRPGTDLWANCSDSANACTNTANWTGVDCDATKTAIVTMFVCSIASNGFVLTHFQLYIRSRCCLSGAGGSLPESIGNMTRLQELCGLICKCLGHRFLFSPSKTPRYSLDLILVHHGCLLSLPLSGTSPQISSVAPFHLSSATSLSSAICTFGNDRFSDNIYDFLMTHLQMISLLSLWSSRSFIVDLSGTSQGISSLAPSHLSSANSLICMIGMELFSLTYYRC